MANTSGFVGREVSSGWFDQESNAARFRVSNADVGLRLDFAAPEREVSGERTLTGFLGSGRVGRSYFFADDRFLYQAPVSYFSERARWDASPGFERRTSIDLTRAIEPACLQCHASRVQHVPATQNRFATVPFLQNGVGCERCHGPGAAHAAKPVAKNIVNPAKLPADRRDSICAQCHLTGAARVARAEPRAKFAPGNLLSDSIAVFVWSGAAASGVTVTSHFEKFSYSKCKQASGARMTCTTCHDPHGASAAASGIIRERCVSCHAAPADHLAKTDCIACHMPKSGAQDLEHVVYTDHSIPRRAGAPPVSAAVERRLEPFWGGVDRRDRALALAVVAMTEASITTSASVRREALDLLTTAAAANPRDWPVVAQLAQFQDRSGQPDRAVPLYERVIAGDASNGAALINLGSLYAQRGRLSDAIPLWQRALARNPALTQARLNLAVAQLQQGDREAGIASLRLALHYDPDSEGARRLLKSNLQRTLP